MKYLFYILTLSSLALSSKISSAGEDFDANVHYFIHGKSIAPWELSLQFGQVKLIDGKGKTTKGSLKAAKATKQTSGDAIKFTWTPKGVMNEWNIADKNVHTLTLTNTKQYLNLLPVVDTAALVIDLKLLKAPRKHVDITMECNWDWKCRSSLPLKNILKNLPTNEWVSLPIPLKCFDNGKLDYSQITSVMQLYSSDKLTLEINNIRLAAITGNELKC